MSRRSIRLRRRFWPYLNPTFAKPSELAQQYLTGLKGIEIGASAHNVYGVDAINVDRYVSDETDYKLAEIEMCGRFRHVDVIARGDDLPFKDDSVDFVLTSHVIEHFPDPIRALEEWVRVARKFVVLYVPHRDRTFDRDRDLTSNDELEQRHREGFTSEEDKHWTVWTCESFISMCDHFGFRVVDQRDPDDKVGNGFAVVIDASVTPAEPAASGAAATAGTAG